MSLEINKVAAAVLTGGIVAMLSGFVAGKLYHPETLEEPAYKIALPEGGGDKPEAPKEESIIPLLASADVEAGKKQTAKCAACHSFDEGGATKVGPNLYGIVGTEHASVPGFQFSDALQKLKSEGKKWNYVDLNDFLKDPRGYAPGTKMVFAGLKKIDQRADVIAYLRTLSANPVPLPSKEEVEAIEQKDADKDAQKTEADSDDKSGETKTASVEAPKAEEPEAEETTTAATTEPRAEETKAEGSETASTEAPKVDETKSVEAPKAEATQTAAVATTATGDSGGSELGKLLAAADVAKGKKVARKCNACHTFEEGGKNKVGPNLYDVIGKVAGESEGYKFSKAMAAEGAKGYTWTYEHLDAYLANPKKAIPGNKMTFPGMRKPQDRADVIAYIRSLSKDSAAFAELVCRRLSTPWRCAPDG